MEVNGLREKLEQLGPIAELLNKASDQLNVQISKIETALAYLNLGIFARIRVPEDKADTRETSCFLGYGKSSNGVWSLFIDSPDQESRWAYQRAPRHYRIKCIDYIPELLEALIKVTDKTTKKLYKVIPVAQEMADAIAKDEKELKDEAKS